MLPDLFDELNLERGMMFAGGPDEIARRILHLHKLLGHSRQILQVDVGASSESRLLFATFFVTRVVKPALPSTVFATTLRNGWPGVFLRGGQRVAAARRDC